MDWKTRITILYACRQCRALFPPIMLNSHVSIIVRPQSLNQLWQYTKQEISEGPICLASDTSETDKSHLISAGVFPATFLRREAMAESRQTPEMSSPEYPSANFASAPKSRSGAVSTFCDKNIISQAGCLSEGVEAT